jgi:hypothetical protein
MLRLWVKGFLFFLIGLSFIVNCVLSCLLMGATPITDGSLPSLLSGHIALAAFVFALRTRSELRISKKWMELDTARRAALFAAYNPGSEPVKIRLVSVRDPQSNENIAVAQRWRPVTPFATEEVEIPLPVHSLPRTLYVRYETSSNGKNRVHHRCFELRSQDEISA